MKSVTSLVAVLLALLAACSKSKTASSDALHAGDLLVEIALDPDPPRAGDNVLHVIRSAGREKHVLRHNQDRSGEIALRSPRSEHVVAGLRGVRPRQSFGPPVRQPVGKIEIVADKSPVDDFSILRICRLDNFDALGWGHGAVKHRPDPGETYRYAQI